MATRKFWKSVRLVTYQKRLVSCDHSRYYYISYNFTVTAEDTAHFLISY